MDIKIMVKMLSALSQETRLGVFRLLVRSGPEGMPAGEIARAFGIRHNTLSTHLAILANAGLLQSRRDSRSIIYSVDFEGTRNLLSFLLEDCCQGQPDFCAPIVDSLLAGCCNPELKTGEQNETNAC